MTTRHAPHSFSVINLRMPVSAPCYPAWQIFVGKSTEIYALPLITPQPKAGSSGSAGISWGESLDTAAIKISVGFYKNCEAIFYAHKKQYDHIKNDASLGFLLLLGQAKSKSPLGGGEPRQDRA